MRQTGHPRFMGDAWNIHDLRLTYGIYASNGRCTECSCFTVDIQGTSVLRKMVRTPKLTKHRQEATVPLLWEHSLTTLLGHDSTSDPGIALRQWVHFQGVHNILDLLSWDQEELKAVPAQQIYSLDYHIQGLYLRTNQIKQMCGLITYMKHVVGAYNSDIDPRDDPFHPFSPDEWSQQTSTMLRTYLIQHLPNPNGPEPVPSGPIPSSRPT